MTKVGATSWRLLLWIAILVFVIGEAEKLADPNNDKNEEETKPIIIENDIVADKDLFTMIERNRGTRQKRVALKDALLWPNGVIPYNISIDVSDNFRKAIRRAFRKMAAKTCIRFVPKQKYHKDYIEFIQGNGCYSSIGRKNGGQVISLGATCVSRVRALHEIMHALGFLHEHSRPDRDKYVKILHWNIEEGQDKNFYSYSSKDVNTLSEPYDFNSILHYDNKAFSKNGQDTIQSLSKPDMRFGDAKRLSLGDVRQIRKLYKCDRKRAKVPGINTNSHCEDMTPGCNSYSEQGDACESNYEFMNTWCQHACGFCGNG